MSSKYLVDYLCRSIVRHLELIDPNTVKEEDRYKIVQGIYWLFHEDSGGKSIFNAPIDSESELWVEYWTTWVATITYTNGVGSWFVADVGLSHRFDQAALS